MADHGASYFTAHDPKFVAVVDDWCDRGLAYPWTDTFHVADPDGITGTTTGPTRYAAANGLRSLVEDLAAGLTIEQRTVETLPATGTIALAMPGPQALRLVGTHPIADEATRATYEPVIAITATYAHRTWDFDGVFINDDPILTWVTDDGSRRRHGRPVLVVHAHPVFAAGHLDDPDAAAPLMLATLSRILNLPEPVDIKVRRWTYAKPLAAAPEPFALAESDGLTIGLCGDAWHAGPRVETAWLSGNSLGTALVR